MMYVSVVGGQIQKALTVHLCHPSPANKVGKLFYFTYIVKVLIIGTNTVDPIQTAPEGATRSGSTLFAILALSFGHITALLNQAVSF